MSVLFADCPHCLAPPLQARLQHPCGVQRFCPHLSALSWRPRSTSLRSGRWSAVLVRVTGFSKPARWRLRIAGQRLPPTDDLLPTCQTAAKPVSQPRLNTGSIGPNASLNQAPNYFLFSRGGLIPFAGEFSLTMFSSGDRKFRLYKDILSGDIQSRAAADNQALTLASSSGKLAAIS